MEFPRRKTRAVRVGPHVIGGGHPILVQSMITENTRDIAACVAAILRLADAGCELVRVTAPTMADAHAIGEIQEKLCMASGIKNLGTMMPPTAPSRILPAPPSTVACSVVRATTAIRSA